MVLNVFSGKFSLPEKGAMRKWCVEHMASLHVKRFYDSWLETIRIGLLAGILPAPAHDFCQYWNIISSMVKPAHLTSPPAVPESGMMDSLFDFRTARIQILSRLGKEVLSNLLKKGDITDAEYRAAMETDPRLPLSVHLPYSQIYL